MKVKTYASGCYDLSGGSSAGKNNEDENENKDENNSGSPLSEVNIHKDGIVSGSGLYAGYNENKVLQE